MLTNGCGLNIRLRHPPKPFHGDDGLIIHTVILCCVFNDGRVYKFRY